MEKIDDFRIAQSYWQKDNVIAEDGFLYTLSSYGLEIYEIGNSGELISLSRLPITISNSIAKKDEFVYISSGNLPFDNLPGKLYQINIEDKQHPIIIEEIDFDYDPWPIEIYGDKINIRLHDILNENYLNYFYSLPDLYLIAQYENYLNRLKKLNETTALRSDDYNQFTVFDLSDVTNPEIIGSGDVSSQHQYGIWRADVYNDTILVCSNNDLVTFWNVNDWNNWEYLSQHNCSNGLMYNCKPVIIDSKMVLVEHGIVELIDISNIYFPEQLFVLLGTVDYIFSASLSVSDENLYITTNCNGIQRLKLIDNTLTFENEYANHYLSRRTMQHNDFLIMAPTIHSFQYFDTTNPTNLINMGDFLPTYNSFFEMSNNRIAVFQDETFDYDIFDISNIHEPVVTNQIEFDSYHICRFDDIDNNSIYFVEDYSNHLKKYDISQMGVSELIFDEILPLNVYTWIIHNGYGYFLEYAGSYNRKLYIYEGLNANQPVLSSTINNFVTNRDTHLKILDGMLVVYTESDMNIYPENRTRFFDISDPNMLVLAFELNTFGEPFIKNDLIFTTTEHCCYIFEKEENSTGTLEPFNIFYDVNSINNISFVEYNNEDYLLLSQCSNIGVFNYEYTPASTENELIKPEYALSNYPNPFKPSGAGCSSGTTILFNLTAEDAKDAEIVIYNIKGQKIRAFDCHPERVILSLSKDEGQYSITWDGRDDNNKPVGSGIYMYQLKVDGKIKASRKCLLLK